jgi:hypothetical protein
MVMILSARWPAYTAAFQLLRLMLGSAITQDKIACFNWLSRIAACGCKCSSATKMSRQSQRSLPPAAWSLLL